MKSHTPTPWIVFKKDGSNYIATKGIHPQLKDHAPIVSLSYAADGVQVYLSDENAAHIVKCVNNHDDLVEALNDALDLLGNEFGHDYEYHAKLREVLAKAKAGAE